ncbi:hypothetical protein KHQ82_01000 [Mycoplasmatota bacterium]|nr:hypothetical protein KHQ82_01000 [Mycoplasmatota bacterium]
MFQHILDKRKQLSDIIMNYLESNTLIEAFELVRLALSHFVIALKLKEIDYVIDIEENVKTIDNTNYLLSVKLLEKRKV